jgi:hypothetical protein
LPVQIFFLDSREVLVDRSLVEEEHDQQPTIGQNGKNGKKGLEIAERAQHQYRQPMQEDDFTGVELEREIKGPWSVAVFTDFGNAFDPEYQKDWEQSVGLGVRWRSPIGQVRFDLAFALTKDAEEERYGLPPARLHFVIGPDL